jgi:hypothetical protein
MGHREESACFGERRGRAVASPVPARRFRLSLGTSVVGPVPGHVPRVRKRRAETAAVRAMAHGRGDPNEADVAHPVRRLYG